MWTPFLGTSIPSVQVSTEAGELHLIPFPRDYGMLGMTTQRRVAHARQAVCDGVGGGRYRGGAASAVSTGSPSATAAVAARAVALAARLERGGRGGCRRSRRAHRGAVGGLVSP